jgi:hypothetical protein
MAEPKDPNRSSDMDPAEDSREAIDRDDREAAERYDDAGPGRDSAGGLSNRSLDEEVQNQRELPQRGDAKPGGRSS